MGNGCQRTWGPVWRLEDNMILINDLLIKDRIIDIDFENDYYLLICLFWLRKNMRWISERVIWFWQDSDVIPFKEMFILVKNLEKGYNCYLVSDTNSIHKNANKLSWF